MERRIKEAEGKKPDRYTELPVDFTRMVKQVLETNFKESFDTLAEKAGHKVTPVVSGRIYPNEILLAVSLVYEGTTRANSFYCSMDFDPNASSPKADDLLGLGVDAVGALLAQVLEEKYLDSLARGSLSALVDSGLKLPFQWTSVKFEKKTVHMRVDAANLELDGAADDFLAKHDPDFKALEEEDEALAEGKFVTGKKRGDH